MVGVDCCVLCVVLWCFSCVVVRRAYVVWCFMFVMFCFVIFDGCCFLLRVACCVLFVGGAVSRLACVVVMCCRCVLPIV